MTHYWLKKAKKSLLKSKEFSKAKEILETNNFLEKKEFAKVKELLDSKEFSKAKEFLKAKELEFFKAKDFLITKVNQSPSHDIEETLQELVSNEQLRVTSQRKYGLHLEKLLNSEEGLKDLGAVAERLIGNNPDSILLIYLSVISLAKQERFEEASDLISSKVVELKLNKTKNIKVRDKQLVALLKVWRVLDLVARENMKWADGDNLKNKNYDELEFLLSDHDLEDPELTSDLILFYAEPYLQGKLHHDYLNICQLAFDKAKTLDKKLKVIYAFRREGIRRLPSYHQNYELAIALYVSLEDEINEFVDQSLLDRTLKNVKTLRTIMNVGRSLGQEAIYRPAKEAIIQIAMSDAGQSTVWTAAFALMEDGKDNYEISKTILNLNDKKPQHASDIQHFLDWAILAEEYQLAYEFFSKQPRKVQESKSALSYVKILHRLKKFKEAEEITRGVHISLLSRSHNLCPYTSWSLVKRSGELKFLKDTAVLYQSIPQPKNPQGVIFITPRSIEQLRKTPIVLLMELKRLGWAVIPLSEGLLPTEKTNNVYINEFIDVITMNREIKRDSKLELDTEFDISLSQGKMQWKDIDLSHVLWEESAINKRIYDVDYTCPALNNYLENIYTTTKSAATVLDNIHKLKDDIGLRIGFIVQFNARLPDALYRFYCEEYGDPKEFFCIHSANGYQNYFSNFSTNISSKCVVRNMTKYPHTRSASFPLPEEFEVFYQENKYRAEEILETVSGVTNVKRSVSYDDDSVEKRAAIQYINSWRAAGKKVVCAFGKVVYDSGVPFDGGAAHSDMKDWINHSIETVNGTDTLLLIKPHPHELNQQISTFGNAVFRDIIQEENQNIIFLDHNWFKMHDLKDLIDFAIVYNGTSSIELGVMDIPAILCGHFGTVDYPVGHPSPNDRLHFEQMLKGEVELECDDELRYKSALWLFYMGSSLFTTDYRYHSRPVTNKVLYPPYWFNKDVNRYLTKGDQNVRKLALEIIE